MMLALPFALANGQDTGIHPDVISMPLSQIAASWSNRSSLDFNRDGLFDKMIVKSVTDNTGAMRVLSAAGGSVLEVNTLNTRVGVGGVPENTLHVFGTGRVTGNVYADSNSYFGGGYGNTGVTITDAGALSMNNNLIVGGTSTLAGTTTIGGGYGSTGVTITNAGALSMNDALIVDRGATINNVAGNYDTVIKGQGVSDLFFVHASTNRVGIGTSTPSELLHVDGNARIDGNLQVVGSVTSLNVTNLNVDGSLLPTVHNLFDVGATANRWRDGFFSRNLDVDGTSYLGNVQISGNTITTSTGNLAITSAGTEVAITENNIALNGATTVANGNAFTANGLVKLGDGGDTVQIDSSDWDISTTGDMSGIGSIALNGGITQTGTGQVTFGGNVDANNGLDVTGTVSVSSDLFVGGTTLVSPFSVDESANTVRIGEGANSNALLNMYASDGDTGEIAYTTNDRWEFSGGSFYLTDNVPTTYIYSANIYLGDDSTDQVMFRSSEVYGNMWRISDTTGAYHAGSNTEYIYNRFGSGGSADYASDGSSDVYIEDELEVDGSTYLGDDATTDSLTLTGSQAINAQKASAALTVNQASTGRIVEFTDGGVDRMYIKDGGIVHIGSGGTENYMTGNGDLYVQGNLEVDGWLYSNVVIGTYRVQSDSHDAFRVDKANGDGVFKVDTIDDEVNVTNRLNIGNVFKVGDSSATRYDYNRIGTGGTVNMATPGNNDLFIADQLEVDGQITFNGNLDATDGIDVTGAALTSSSGLTVTGGSVDFPANSIPGDDIQDGTVDSSEIEDDTLDYADFQDTLDLDASTTLNFAGYTYTENLNGVGNSVINLASTGDFIIQDAGVSQHIFYDNGDVRLGESNELYVDTDVARVGIGTASPRVSLDVGYKTDAIIIPVGTNAQRNALTPVTGMIRYNSDASTFEGYGGSAWGSLGGVMDVDQDTYVSAENTPGSDNDQLRFYTLGTVRMRIEPGTTTYFNTSVLPILSNTYDLGSGTYKWRDGHFGRDLYVDGTIYADIAGALDPDFTPGSVVFADGDGKLAQDNPNFFWDDTTNRLGLGVNTGVNSRLTLAAGTTAADGILFGADTNLYRSAANTLRTDDNVVVGGTTYSIGNLYSGGDIYTTGAGDDLWLGTATQGSANFRAYADGTLYAGNTATIGLGLTVSAGGASITGGINNNAGGITNAGAISGATTISSSGAATLDTAGSGSTFGGSLGIEGSLYDITDATLTINDNLHVTGGRVTGANSEYISIGETNNQVDIISNGAVRARVDTSSNFGIEGSLYDISQTVLTINDDLQVIGNDILDSAGTTRLTLGASGTYTGNLNVTGNLGVTQELTANSLKIGGGYQGGGLTINENGDILTEGDLYYINTLAMNGSLQVNNSLTVLDGASISGGINNNNGGITNAGAISGVSSIEGNFGNIASSTDEWLRLNHGSTHTNGVYIPNDVRSDGEIRQGATDYGGYEIQTGGQLYVDDYGVFMGGVHVGGTSDPGTDNLLVDGTATVQGNINANGNIVGDSVTAISGMTSIDGTGDLTMGTITMTGFSVDADGTTVIAGVPTAASAAGASLFVNPATATANYGLIGASVGAVEKFRVDAEGDVIIAGSIDAAGSIDIDGGTITDGGANFFETSGDAASKTVSGISSSGTISYTDIAISDAQIDGGLSGQILISDGTDAAWTTMSNDVQITSAGVATIQPNAVALGTDTTGNYVATVTNTNAITVGSSGTENAAVTIGVTADSLDFDEFVDTMTLDAAWIVNAGANARHIVFNEDSYDIDFRVESNGNANMLRVNGGLDMVGIGKDPSLATLDVAGSGAFSTKVETPQINVTGGGPLTIDARASSGGNGNIIIYIGS